MGNVKARAELKRLSPNAGSLERRRAFEKLMRDFKRAVDQSRVKKEYAKHEFFSRACDERRSKRNRRLTAAREEFSEQINKKGGKDGEKRNYP